MIGQWFARHESRPWHLVESVVTDDVVTRCGRRMDIGRKPSVWNPVGTEPDPETQCQQCRRGAG